MAGRNCDSSGPRLLYNSIIKLATQEFGASVFWVRPSAILVGTLEEFVAHWQVKRDKTRRGIVEVTA